jgi:VWFA-related protein
MYATENGRAIEDLKPEEIELREDGVPQKVEQFEYVRIEKNVPESVRVDPQSVDQSRQMAANPRSRVFVVFLDTFHSEIEASSRMREPLVRFLERMLGRDDLVAIMTPEMSARDLAFTPKTTLLSDMLRREAFWGKRGRLTPTDDTEAKYDGCYPDWNREGRNSVASQMKARRAEKLTLDALEDLVVVLGGLREERKAVLTVSDGWMQYAPSSQLAAAPRGPGGAEPPPIFGPDPRARATGRQDAGDMMRECEADRLALAMMDDRDRLQRIGAEANRANVSFYPIDGRGLVVFDSPIGPDPPPTNQEDASNLRTSLESQRYIAAETDGMAIVNTNSIDRGIDRIVTDLSSYYLLGYYSTNQKLDGKFRSINVKVTRPRVQVRARRGYRALTADQMPAVTTATAVSKPPAPDASFTKAMNSAVVDERASFRLRSSSWVMPSPGAAAARMWIVGEIDSRRRRDATWSGGAQAEVTVVRGDGTPALTKMVEMAAADGTFAIRVPETGTVTPGEYDVRVRVRPKGDPSLPVSDIVRIQMPATPSVLGEPVLSRRGPATGVKYVVTADPRFMRTERMRLELPSRTTSTATAKLLDRSGKDIAIPLQVGQRDDPGADFHWIVVDATLAPLAAGDYVIEVTVDDARQVMAFKVVP